MNLPIKPDLLQENASYVGWEVFCTCRHFHYYCHLAVKYAGKKVEEARMWAGKARQVWAQVVALVNAGGPAEGQGACAAYRLLNEIKEEAAALHCLPVPAGGRLQTAAP